MLGQGLLRGDIMKRQIISIVERTMGFLLCVCLAGLFALLMTWLILELKIDATTARGSVFKSDYGMSVRPPADEQYVSWETRARVDKAWRDEYLQNETSLRSEFDSYGDRQDRQSMNVTASPGYALEK